ncbi:transport permease protein [Pseudomonas sp. CYM-20-01]|uniref:ABC transporter permease n=1 Tax=Pseudomonas sp. CYM-20-01 TaxID=2870750 RepID=UPI00204F9B0C|nr:ABC transporter permease [Pseudomonas sp. CYM-20-01]BDB19803.1 transport permease protein [Pseudomonas sp. CYM-20-01]
MIKRDILGRYRGSVIGLAWSFLNPLLMLLVYTLVFSVMFKQKWLGASESRGEFALLVFAGLLVFNIFAECMQRAPTLIVQNANYVKKVIFPLEILPWVSLGSVLAHTTASLVIWLVFHLFLLGPPPLTALLLPLVLLPLVLFSLGVSWLLAGLGVYLRDISQVTTALTTALLFVSAVFYPINVLPEAYQAVLLLNPIALIIEQVRDVLFWGKLIDPLTWSLGLSMSCCVAWLGFQGFQRMRSGFADVL